MKKPRLLLADDHLVAEGLRGLLEPEYHARRRLRVAVNTRSLSRQTVNNPHHKRFGSRLPSDLYADPGPLSRGPGKAS